MKIISDTEIKNNTRRENYRTVSLMSADAKILNKTLRNQIRKYKKKIIVHSLGFVSGTHGWFSILKINQAIYPGEGNGKPL